MPGPRPGVEAEDLFSMFYGKLCEHLSASHRVERFPYDWRQPLDVLAERLGEFLDRLMKQTDKPIRLLAHSMGGLVVRACIHKRRAVMDALMKRDGARLVMLGTPNQGAHSMVENLLGKGSTLRTLVRLDLKHDMQQVLDIVAGFRGALQLLPKPGFKDIFQGQPDGGGHLRLPEARRPGSTSTPRCATSGSATGKSGKPSQAVLDCGQLAVGAGRRGHAGAAGRVREEGRVRFRRRTQHALRRARGTDGKAAAAEDGRHDARRRHGHLGVGPHRRHRRSSSTCRPSTATCRRRRSISRRCVELLTTGNHRPG